MTERLQLIVILPSWTATAALSVAAVGVLAVRDVLRGVGR